MFVKQDVHGEIDQERAGQASSNPAAPAVVQEASKVLRCSPSKTMPTKSISTLAIFLKQSLGIAATSEGPGSAIQRIHVQAATISFAPRSWMPHSPKGTNKSY